MASQELESVDVVEVKTDSSTRQEQAQNPWPHLDDYFLIMSREGNRLIFNCKLCLPRTVPIKGHISSLNNLKQHIRRTHPAKFMQFEETVKAGSCRGKAKKRFSGFNSSSSSIWEMSSMFSSPSGKKAHQQTIVESFDITATGSCIRQAAVDQRIVDFFVVNMLPLHIVESDTFERLIKTLNPSKNSMSRRTLGRRIVHLHTDLKQYLIRVLEDVQWVATTADCWSAHKKSYLGMTVHWLDPTTRQRRKAVLGCIRLTGHHTYDVLAQAMVNVHYAFHIESKVTRTTTDNGSNFVKLEYVSLEDSLAVPVAINPVIGIPINLPAHMRCAAHTFNLVASKDADAALQSAVFKMIYSAAMAKAHALWNQQDRSTVAADIIYAEMGRRLVVPNTTRWNSIYDSVVVLNTLLETKRPVLHRVMTQMKVISFNDQDVDLMKEYAKVMSPVAKALDKIQEEGQAYLGTLLPTVAATIFMLKDLKSKGLVYCIPLIDALLAGIDKRFRTLLEDEECQLAAAFHPRFRLIWLEKYDNTKVAKVRKSMEGKVEEAMRQQSNEVSSITGGSNNEEVEQQEEEEEDDFFSGVTQSKESSRSHRSLKDKAQNLVKTWLESNSNDLLTNAAFLGEQILVDLFIKFNTAIPSSAAVECLLGKDMLRTKRSSLSDENFDMLVFIKGNMHLMNKMET